MVEPARFDMGLRTLSDFWLAAGTRMRNTAEPLPTSHAEFDYGARIGRESPPFVASGKLMSAYDGARAAAILWREGEVHIVADYALLRVVTETAIVAWWVMSSSDPDERARRAFRVVVDDLLQAKLRELHAVKNARTRLGRSTRGAALTRIEAEIVRVQTEMRASRIEISEKFMKGERLSLRHLFIEAERTIEGATDLMYTLLWSIASTSAHGSLTAIEQLTTNAGDQNSPTALTDASTVFVFAEAAAHILNAAHVEWNRYTGRQ